MQSVPLMLCGCCLTDGAIQCHTGRKWTSEKMWYSSQPTAYLYLMYVCIIDITAAWVWYRRLQFIPFAIRLL